MPGEKSYQHEFFDTTSAADFVLKNADAPPHGYPERWLDGSYSEAPFSLSFEERRETFFAHALKNPSRKGIKGWFYELIRVHLNKQPVYEGIIKAAIEYINERFDCSDFVMLGIIRLLYQFGQSPSLSPELIQCSQNCLLDFKYWPDEPGLDSMCYWTENHQIMFSTNEYLAGQLYPDKIFSNSGMTGKDKIAKARPRIMKWLELRYMTGFSEWLSNVYYDEDITALINLIDFCQDTEIVVKSKIVLDLIFLDMALNSFNGCFASTHGRSYRKEKMSALVESTTDTFKLMFGTGVYAGQDNMSAVCLSLSDNYRLPGVIFDIANDSMKSMVNRQRMGINIKEAKKWGLNLKNSDDLMTLLSMEAYTHPLTFKGVMDLFDRFRWWDNQFFSMFKKMKPLIRLMCATGTHRLVTKYFEKDITRNTREEVNICTYRTPEYMLSSAVSYKPGYGGDQQHIWQATLGPETVCFTTHPGHMDDTSAGYWVGSGNLPCVAQQENVLIACYRISKRPGLYMTNKLFFTHAYFPRDKFDEVVSRSGWVFGRKGKGYIALYSKNNAVWQDTGEYKDRELIADGLKNIWVCEMGSASTHGTFTEFVERVSLATIIFEGEKVRYNSPSQGKMQFSYNGSFMVKGKPVPLKDYPRYDNWFVQAAFPLEVIEIRHTGHYLRLDFENEVREEGEMQPVLCVNVTK
jgi:hypothetical protein